jgi:hypothetical protein
MSELEKITFRISPRYLNKLSIVFTIMKAAGDEGLKIKIIKNENV